MRLVDEMDFDDILYDTQLNMKTTDRDDTFSDTHHYPYEPTQYRVLDRIVEESVIDGCAHIIDYGCGKGRVSIYLANKMHCLATGIDLEDSFVADALANLNRVDIDAEQKEKIEFYVADASQFVVPSTADVFYFFNPFSVSILASVIERIKESYYNNPRQMTLLFYYPSDEYVSFLMREDALLFDDEIDCRDLFDGQDERERVLIYRME